MIIIIIRITTTTTIISNLYLSIRTKSNIYNFKLYRIVCKLKTKYMSMIENYFTIIIIIHNTIVHIFKILLTKKPTKMCIHV